MLGLVLAVSAVLAFRNTSITVTPLSRVGELAGAHVTAYPAATAVPGALSYMVVSKDFEDSAVAPSNGMETVSERASGKVTLYNEYSASTVRLVKNTRLSTGSGLIFRVPVDVVVPGKKGSAPGSITITAVADKAGEQYNLQEPARFSVPGLAKTPTMYARVYGRSTAAFTGGFVGERPAVAAGALESARSEVRERLAEKARESALSEGASGDFLVLPDLVRVSYESLPQTAEAGGGVRIREQARVDIPLFPRVEFAWAVGGVLGVDTNGVALELLDIDALAASADGTSSSSKIGEGPLEFSLSGKAIVVWSVDGAALSKALAGRSEDEFKSIVARFPSIAEARARIEPFWRSTFPEDSGDIRVKIALPDAQ